jgi:hypothetical protein
MIGSSLPLKRSAESLRVGGRLEMEDRPMETILG